MSRTVPPFDANLLVTLATLVRTCSVTRTAAQLGTSQPSVSRALAQLRQLLDDPLLVRTGGGMALTRRAEELVHPLQQWMAVTGALLEPQAFDPSLLTRRFRVASTDFGVTEVIAPSLPIFMLSAPDAVLEIVPLRGAMVNELGSGEVDLLVSGLEPDPNQAYERHLFQDRFSCLFRRDHPIGRGVGPIPLEDFLAAPHVTMTVGDDDFDRVDHCLGANGRKRRVVARLPYFAAAPSAIAASDALVTLPSRAAHVFAATYGLGVRDAPEMVGAMQYRLLWHGWTARDPASRWLRDLLAAPFTHSSAALSKSDLDICLS